jgi:hypothetical protein
MSLEEQRLNPCLVRTDFFEEIFVPYKELPEGCEL